eukprot:TRINITY_DN95364_c0_g1_i1.p1 TRINITY_DN95364_c0_g1~~TRINITY_DN95364_c0_g1_i1.p1  ORF type:complete len:110 (+),score=10.29 TRINITY_DN95364_c0_g1_i1:27-332(+)
MHCTAMQYTTMESNPIQHIAMQCNATLYNTSSASSFGDAMRVCVLDAVDSASSWMLWTLSRIHTGDKGGRWPCTPGFTWTSFLFHNTLTSRTVSMPLHSSA